MGDESREATFNLTTLTVSTAAEDFEGTIVGRLQGLIYTVAGDEHMGTGLKVGVSRVGKLARASVWRKIDDGCGADYSRRKVQTKWKGKTSHRAGEGWFRKRVQWQSSQCCANPEESEREVLCPVSIALSCHQSIHFLKCVITPGRIFCIFSYTGSELLDI